MIWLENRSTLSIDRLKYVLNQLGIKSAKDNMFTSIESMRRAVVASCGTPDVLVMDPHSYHKLKKALK